MKGTIAHYVIASNTALSHLGEIRPLFMFAECSCKGIKILKNLFFSTHPHFFLTNSTVPSKKNEDDLKKKRCFKILMPLRNFCQKMRESGEFQPWNFHPLVC